MRHPWIVGLFALAMGILEAAVVVYIRRISHPAGFAFPLPAIDAGLIRTEILREAMTIVMLACVAWIAAERAWPRLLAFLFAFGVWDIAYYLGLKLLLDWPPSLLAPDVLFLIPKAWVGPVAAPVLVSAAWVAGALLLQRTQWGGLGLGWTWILGGLASLGLIVASFLLPAGTPEQPGYLWGLFAAGFGIELTLLALAVARARGRRRSRG